MMARGDDGGAAGERWRRTMRRPRGGPAAERGLGRAGGARAAPDRGVPGAVIARDRARHPPALTPGYHSSVARAPRLAPISFAPHAL